MLEPVLERNSADARISAGGERLIVDYQAIVAGINVCDDLHMFIHNCYFLVI
jgi:hypothetical protein